MRIVRIDTAHLNVRHHSAQVRTLPLCLLILIVCTLVAVTISQIAIMHRINPRVSSLLAQQHNTNTQASTTSTSTITHSLPLTIRVKGQQRHHPTVPPKESFKIEPLLVKNAPSVERKALLLVSQMHLNAIQRLIRRAQQRMTLATNQSNQHEHVVLKWACRNDQLICRPSVETAQNSSDVTANATLQPNTLGHPLGQQDSPVQPLCPQVPTKLVGKIGVWKDENVTMDHVTIQNGAMHDGGTWMPVNCSANHRVAIIIPYRDRLDHLAALLSRLHPILQRQELHYKVYVVEQFGNTTFNKGVLMNAAFTIAFTDFSYHCFVFHDVDLIPEDDRNMYSCPPQPRHLSVAVNEFNYRLPYKLLVGGVFAIRTEHFLRVNGYSNMYWGWGGEDDDMACRIYQAGLSIIRPAETIARYTMIKHKKRKPLNGRIRHKLLRTARKRMRLDGLNTLNVTLISTKKEQLFTRIVIDVGIPPIPTTLL